MSSNIHKSAYECDGIIAATYDHGWKCLRYNIITGEDTPVMNVIRFK